MVAPLEPLLSGWRSAPLPDLHGTWSVAPGGRAFAIAGLADQIESSLLVVVPGERDAEELVDDISLFVDNCASRPGVGDAAFRARLAEHRHDGASL